MLQRQIGRILAFDTVMGNEMGRYNFGYLCENQISEVLRIFVFYNN